MRFVNFSLLSGSPAIKTLSVHPRVKRSLCRDRNSNISGRVEPPVEGHAQHAREASGQQVGE